jgi:hypothetical protein
MKRQLLVSFGILAAVSMAPLAGQAQKKVAAKTSAPKNVPYARTPWGDPDLQGVWNDATSTPLQRPNAVGAKDVLSDDEAAEFQDQLKNNLSRDRRDGGAEADVNRAYNEHWMDSRRLKITSDHRTSLIVDPPDGRIPPLVPLSPERQKAAALRAAANTRFNAGLPESYRDFTLPVRCIIRTDSPPYLPIIYNNDFQIFQSPGFVVINPEMIHSARIIPIDKPGSYRSTSRVRSIPISGRICGSGWAIRAGIGTATRWWSKRPISAPTTALFSWGRTRRPTASRSASRASTRPRSTTNSRSRIRTPGRGRGPREFPGARSIRPSRCTNTRATRITTTWATS